MSVRAELDAALERRHALRRQRQVIDREANAARRIAELKVARTSFETRRAQA